MTRIYISFKLAAFLIIMPVIFLTIPATEALACGTVSLTSTPTYMQCDARVTSYIRARVVGPDGKPANGSITFSIAESPSSSDKFSKSTVPVKNGVANTTFYHYPSGPGKIRIMAVAKIVTEYGNFYPEGYAELYALKLELTDYVKYIRVNAQALFTAKVTPEVPGLYLWKITKGSTRAQIIADWGKTVVVSGIKASRNSNDITINLVFKPGGPTDWIRPINYAFTVFEIVIACEPNYIAAETIWPGMLQSEQDSNLLISKKPVDLKTVSMFEIKEVTPEEPATGDGTVKQVSDTRWTYTAFEEIKTLKDPGRMKTATIAATVTFENFKDCASLRCGVDSVFRYLSNPGIGVKPDRERGWRYARWKYDINTSSLRSIRYNPRLGRDKNAITDYNDNCIIGPGAFDSENICASTLGHENVHGNQELWYRILSDLNFTLHLGIHYAEVEAYDWEIRNASATGLSGTELLAVIKWKNYYNRQGPKP